MLASLSAFVGTITGKILVGTTVAAASLTGAHAAGVVDIPGLPEIDDAAVTETIDDRQDDDLDDADGSGPGDSEGDGSGDSDSGDSDSGSDSGESDDPAVSTSSTTSTTTSTTSTTTTAPPTSTTSTTSTSTSTVPPSSTITKAYTVAGVGTTTVTVTDLQITLVSAVPAAGWTLDEAGPDEDGVESEYVNGDLETRIDFEIEDGQLRVRVREENRATDERTERFEYFPLS